VKARVFALTVVALLAVAAGAGAAGSAGVPPNALPVTSTISIASFELGFHGRVRAPLPFCRSHRRVALLKVVRGGRDEVMGHARTGAGGKWSISVSGFAGVSLARFNAVARRKRGHFARLPYVCAAATSRTIGLGP
jgi:hypothetical protein